MTGILGLDWAIQAVSLFNVILLIWLGLTVLLNAERRTGGILLTSGGLLMGGAFFVSHSALLGHEADVISAGQDVWWYIGWAPVISLPLLWYVVMLWYNGFWAARQSAEAPERHLYLRQRFWFGLALLMGGLLVMLLTVGHLLPPFSQLAQFRTFVSPTLYGALSIRRTFPLVVVYPIYALLCMGQSLDALLRPGPSRRWLGELARRRAQPWLLAASILLMAVSLLVGAVMSWIIFSLDSGNFTAGTITVTGIFDLIIASMIALSVLALGQAVVSYEIFTARTLPRNGLVQYWRRAVILALGYSALVALALTLQLRPIYSLLLTTLLMTVFFALLAWRSYAERERLMRSLRPFLASPKVYTRIIEPGREGIAGEGIGGEGAALDVSGAFRSLCSDVLETRQACLAPLGAMTALAGPPVFYPDQTPSRLLALNSLEVEFQSPDEKGLPLDPQYYQGYIWAISLWNERGLVGVLLLGEKRADGLYSQEEIETARAAGERLVDLKASAELARRLAILERQHLAQNQVLDQQTRRILHDEILPLIHTALLSLAGNAGSGADESMALLTQVHRQISDLLRSMAATLSPDIKRLGFLGALQQVVKRDLAGALDQVDWQVDPAGEAYVQSLPPLESEVLFFAAREALRNAARYGRPDNGSLLKVTIRVTYLDELRLVIEDNGNGRETTDHAAVQIGQMSSGQGLALHSTLMTVIGGSLSLEREPGRFTRAILSLPANPSLYRTQVL